MPASASSDKPILIIDGSNLAHRCRHTFSLSYKGMDTSITYGFLRNLWSLLGKFKPEVVIVCWDGGAPEFRYKLCPTYKRRDHGDEEDYAIFLQQVRELQYVLPVCGVSSVRRLSIEADDLMYQAGVLLIGTKVVVTTDQDMLQMVANDLTGATSMYSPIKDVIVTHDGFAEFTEGVYPDEWMTYRMLVGDSSDGVPGVKGIGPAKALGLLDTYGPDVTAMLNAANGIGDPNKPRMQDGVAKALRMHGLQGFCDDNVVMRLDRDLTGSRQVLLAEFAMWEQVDMRMLLKYLLSRGFDSLMNPDATRSLESLRSPESRLRNDLCTLRLPVVAPVRVPAGSDVGGDSDVSEEAEGEF